MTQHIDKVALAIWRTRYPISAASGGKWSLAESKQCLAAARAAMRAVVKQMREPSGPSIETALLSWIESIPSDTGYRSSWPDDWTDEQQAAMRVGMRIAFVVMLAAYAKEAGIDE